MKLTIKNKLYKKKQNQQQKSVTFNHDMWCSQYVGRKKIILQNNKQLSNIIYADIYQYYSRIVPKQKISSSNIHTFIIETVQYTKCPYSRGLGFLCCHLYVHYNSQNQRNYIINTMLSTHKSIYLKNNQKIKFSVINSAADRLQQYCQSNHQILSQIQIYQIIQTYIQTLLLQYIPLQYSQFIIKIYITNPYQQFIRLFVSLVHFVLNTRNITSAAHANNILKNPYMGLIQWPIVISNRFTFVKQEWSNTSSVSLN